MVAAADDDVRAQLPLLAELPVSREYNAHGTRNRVAHDPHSEALGGAIGCGLLGYRTAVDGRGARDCAFTQPCRLNRSYRGWHRHGVGDAVRIHRQQLGTQSFSDANRKRMFAAGRRPRHGVGHDLAVCPPPPDEHVRPKRRQRHHRAGAVDLHQRCGLRASNGPGNWTDHLNRCESDRAALGDDPRRHRAACTCAGDDDDRLWRSPTDHRDPGKTARKRKRRDPAVEPASRWAAPVNSVVVRSHSASELWPRHRDRVSTASARWAPRVCCST